MLLAMEKLLAEAVAQFARGEAPFPDGLYSEVAALRRRADTLFDAAVNAAGREG